MVFHVNVFRTNAERLFSMVERLQKLLVAKLGNEGYDKTVRAANVYKKMLIALEEAREAATSALNKAISAYEKVRYSSDLKKLFNI